MDIERQFKHVMDNLKENKNRTDEPCPCWYCTTGTPLPPTPTTIAEGPKVTEPELLREDWVTIGGQHVLLDDDGSDNTDTGKGRSGVHKDKPDSALGKRFVEHDENGAPKRIIHVTDVATYKDNDTDANLHYTEVEKDQGTGRWMVKSGGHFITHKELSSGIKSGKFSYHSASKGFEPKKGV